MRNRQEIFRADLPHRAVAVYLYLLGRVNREGTCFPGIQTIAQDIKVSPNTVKRGIQDLKRAGFLSTEQRYRENGGKSTLLYTLH